MPANQESNQRTHKTGYIKPRLGAARRWMMYSLVLSWAWVVSAAADVDALLERVPAGSIAVFTWQGFDDADPAYADSTFKAMLDDTDLVARCARFLGAIGERAAQEQGGDAENDLAAWTDAVRELWQSPAVLYFGGVDFGDAVAVEGEPRVKPSLSFGVLLEVDGEAAAPFRTFFNRAVEDMQNESDLAETQVELIDADGVIGFRASKPGNEPPASITTDERYTGAFDHGDATRHMSFYLDVPAGLAALRETVAFDNGEEDLADFDRFVQGFGVDGLGRFAGASGFVDRQWQSTLTLEAPAPRRGFIRLLDQGPLRTDTLKLTTKTSPWARTFRFDALHTYDTVIGTIRGLLEEPEVEEMDQDLAQFREQLGFDLRDDLLALLGADWLVYADASFGGMYGTGLAVVHDGLKDPEALDARLHDLTKKFNAEGQRNGMPFQWMPVTVGELDVQTLPIPIFSPSWVIADGRLVFANSPQSVFAAVQAARDPERHIETSDAFAAVSPWFEDVAGNPQAKLTSRMVVDTQRTAVTVHQTITMFAAMLGGEVQRELGVSPLEAIPPLNTLTPHLGPAGSVSWVDDAGFHSRSRMPFPGATLLSPEAYFYNTEPAVLAAGTGIMLPALGAARREARQTAAMSHMRQILIGMHTYAVDHEGRFPPNLDVLHTDDYLPNDDVFRHPADERPFAEPSFLLVLPGARHEDVEQAGQTIALIEREDFDGDGMINVGYADGHVERHTLEHADELLTEQTGRSLEQWANAGLKLD